MYYIYIHNTPETNPQITKASSFKMLHIARKTDRTADPNKKPKTEKQQFLQQFRNFFKKATS